MTWPPKSPANTASLEEAEANTAGHRKFWRKYIREQVFAVILTLEPGEVLTADDIELPDLPEIHASSLPGIEIRKMSLEGLLQKVGYTPSTRKSRRGGVTAIYVATDVAHSEASAAGVGAGGETTEQKEGRSPLLSSSPDPGDRATSPEDLAA